MLYAMERKVKGYTIEANVYIHDWMWNLLPSIQLSFDEVFFGVHFSFLCFNLMIDITNDRRAEEWYRKIEGQFDSFDEESYWQRAQDRE